MAADNGPEMLTKCYFKILTNHKYFAYFSKFDNFRYNLLYCFIDIVYACAVSERQFCIREHSSFAGDVLTASGD